VHDREFLALQRAELAQITAANGSMAGTSAFFGFTLMVLMIAIPVLTGCGCCGDRACCCDGKYLLSVVPVVSDMIFEIIHSRGLAIVEATAFFLLLVATYFDARLCHSTFAIRPEVVPITDAPLLSGNWSHLWPREVRY
jgi:hypothetical protein